METQVAVQPASERQWLWLRQSGACVLLFLIVDALTSARFIADTVSYAIAIQKHDFSDFGHLLWYPLAALVNTGLAPLLRGWLHLGALGEIIWTEMFLDWAAGLGCALLLHALLRRFCPREWVIWLATAAFLCTHAFLNLFQAGVSYVPGLAMLLLGYWCLLRRDAAHWGWAVAAGIALGCCIGFWVPYLWGVPAALAAPLLFYGFTQTQRRNVMVAMLLLAVTVGAIFLTGAAHQGVRSVADFRAWVAESSHGANSSGIPRAALGLARSYLHLGNDGLLFKRYLVHDPYNPVGASELLRASFWKVALFYAALALLLWTLWRKQDGRRFLWLWLLAAIPVCGFGVAWQGGDMERYLALLPPMYLGFGYALAQASGKSLARVGLTAFCLMLIGVNLTATRNAMALTDTQKIEQRVADLPTRIAPQSMVFTVNKQDELFAFTRTFPFHPLNQGKALPVYSLAELGTTQVTVWRQEFAQAALRIWQAHGEVWVSARVRSPRPQSGWYWAEGADPEISWKHLHEFFAPLESSATVGSTDGFVLLPPTEANRARLATFTLGHQLAAQSGH